jgi:hypothetical protein
MHEESEIVLNQIRSLAKGAADIKHRKASPTSRSTRSRVKRAPG